MRWIFTPLIFITFLVNGQSGVPDGFYILQPDRVFDGEEMHEGWSVIVTNHYIIQVGKVDKIPDGCKPVPLRNCTLLPGFIEGHSHLFLHPYNETSWDDQVLRESVAERTARAVNHARNTLYAGFTTIRDLGTEGAGYADAGLKEAISKGIVPGPNMLIATRAIVATGSYGPKSSTANPGQPKGAAEADGMDAIVKEVRTQIGYGADLIKVYADYRWGVEGKAAPTFTQEELTRIVEVTQSSNRYVVAHASTAEGMKRAVLAGVRTIEHGDNGTKEVFELMKEKGVALCPTLSAGEAIEQYRGWKKGVDPETDRLRMKRESFQLALTTGVVICFGGDVGVYRHGDNAREMEAMVAYGMKPLDVLRSATAVNADMFGIAGKTGRIKEGLRADIVVIKGNPAADISAVREIKLVMKDGSIVLNR